MYIVQHIHRNTIRLDYEPTTASTHNATVTDGFESLAFQLGTKPTVPDLIITSERTTAFRDVIK